MVFRCAETHSFFAIQSDVPAEVLRLLPRGGNRIYYLELLWPAAAAVVWKQELANSSALFFEDNEGAKFNLLRAFSKDFTSSLFLAVFWGAAAAQKSRPWIDRVASGDNPADCLTKPKLCKAHLSGAMHISPKRLDTFWKFLAWYLRQDF